MIRTVIAEDSKFVQKYLSDMLEREGDFRIVAICEDAFDAEKLCLDGGVDLVLMDVQTAHNHSGLAAGGRIRASGLPVKVVIVTSLIDPAVLAAAKAGAADSLWYKDHGSAEITDVIRRTVSGERVFPDAAPRVELKDMFSDEITPRQMQVLRRFVLGFTYEQIAGELKMTANGVRWNLDQIVEKGGFKNKHEMLATVLANKLIVDAILETE